MAEGVVAQLKSKKDDLVEVIVHPSLSEPCTSDVLVKFVAG